MRYRKNFPIKFFQEQDKVIYQNNFLQGEAKDLNSALYKIAQDDFINDLLLYYNDIYDVKIGKFIPSPDYNEVKGKKYLGKLELRLELSDVEDEQTVAYLSKHKDQIDNYQKNILKQKRQKRVEKIKDKFKLDVINFLRRLRGKDLLTEMFDPLKTNIQLYCVHCGKEIPIGAYFESYRNQNYHIECIWDKIVNKKQGNDYEDAKAFFFGLQKFIGNWPGYGYDVEEDYLSDLELVKANERRILQKVNEALKELL